MWAIFRYKKIDVKISWIHIDIFFVHLNWVSHPTKLNGVCGSVHHAKFIWSHYFHYQIIYINKPNLETRIYFGWLQNTSLSYLENLNNDLFNNIYLRSSSTLKKRSSSTTSVIIYERIFFRQMFIINPWAYQTHNAS